MFKKPAKQDTMVDAIALSSPSGRMSARARRAAGERGRIALFGGGGLEYPICRQPTECERLERTAKELRELAARGISPRKHIKRAKELEREAAAYHGVTGE